MASTTSGIEYPVASDSIAPLNAHMQLLAETTQTALDNRVPAGSWTAYTPTFSGTIYSGGTSQFYYTTIGKTVIVRGKVTLGSSTSFGGYSDITVPSALPMSNNLGGTVFPLGQWLGFSGAGYASGKIINISTTYVRVMVDQVSGSIIRNSELTDTNPFAWGVGDTWECQFMYETA